MTKSAPYLSIVTVMLMMNCTWSRAADASPDPIHATEPPKLVHFSGKVYSSTGSLPKLGAFAECDDGRPRVIGKVEGGLYQIDLPAGASCRLYVAEWDWDSAPLLLNDVTTAVPLPVLVYPKNVPERALARELIKMGQEQALRGSWSQTDSDSLERAEAADDARQRRLVEIIAAKGWPTLSMVGADAADAAWRIAQHAPPERLKAWLVLMQEAAARHELALPNLARSIDRVLALHDNKKQLYGTHYRLRADGMSEHYPIDDVAHLDQRRLSMGLSTYVPAKAGCENFVDELSGMASADQILRRKLDGYAADKPAQQKLFERIELFDQESTRQLKSLIARCGWPAKAQYGKSAVNNAWLLAQHSADLAFQKQVLTLIEKAAQESGNLLDTNAAYLSDRIAAFESRPQLYGTQMRRPFADKPCDIEFLPMDDREKVEARRRALGLEPLDAYRKLLLEDYNCPAELPGTKSNEQQPVTPAANGN